MQRYLSFSGGGFNSHSLLAGMIAGSLDALEKDGRIRDLGLLTRSVDGFSANSGGAWFLSQLSYSQKFLNQFTTSQSAVPKIARGLGRDRRGHEPRVKLVELYTAVPIDINEPVFLKCQFEEQNN